MKKLLSILGSISLVSSIAPVCVSCSDSGSSDTTSHIEKIDYDDSIKTASILFGGGRKIPISISKQDVQVWEVREGQTYPVGVMNVFVNDQTVKVVFEHSLAGNDPKTFDINIVGLDTTTNNTFTVKGQCSKIDNIDVLDANSKNPKVTLLFDRWYTFPEPYKENIKVVDDKDNLQSIVDLVINKEMKKIELTLGGALQKEDQTRYEIRFAGINLIGEVSFYVEGNKAVEGEAAYSNDGYNGNPKVIYVTLRDANNVSNNLKKEDIVLTSDKKEDLSNMISSFRVEEYDNRLLVYLKDKLNPKSDTWYSISIKDVKKENSDSGTFLVRGCQPQITSVEYTKSFYPNTTNNGDAQKPAVYVYAAIYNYNSQGHYNISASEVKIVNKSGDDFSDYVFHGWLDEWPMRDRNVIVLSKELPKGEYKIDISWFSSNGKNSFIVQ